MLLTTTQVRERLGLSSNGRVLTLVKHGLLSPVNGPKEGKKKFFPRFESKAVGEYIKTHGKPTGRYVARPTPTPTPTNGHGEVYSVQLRTDSPVIGIATRLDRIDAKIDRLIALWS